jgi:hypothetical protein
MRTCIYDWKILLKVRVIENVRYVIGMEHIMFFWILQQVLQITGEEKVIFNISVLNRRLCKRNDSQFYVAA